MKWKFEKFRTCTVRSKFDKFEHVFGIGTCTKGGVMPCVGKLGENHAQMAPPPYEQYD